MSERRETTTPAEKPTRLHSRDRKREVERDEGDQSVKMQIRGDQERDEINIT